MNEDSDIQTRLGVDLAAIPGWLAPMACLYTLALSDGQCERGIGGTVLEIGIYKGKFLALLYKASAADSTAVTGIDAFIGSQNTDADEREVIDNVARACGDAERLTIVTADSRGLTPGSLRDLAGGPARLISIDGGHTLDAVTKDLENCLPLLVQGGVIALDDFFNHGTPEVTEAFFAVFRASPDLDALPFAHCYNKLFLTTRSHHAEYLAATHAFLERHAVLPACERTLARHRENCRLGFTPRLLSAEILPFF